MIRIAVLLLFAPYAFAQSDIDSLLTDLITPPYKKEVQHIGDVQNISAEIIRVSPIDGGQFNYYLAVRSKVYDPIAYTYTALLTKEQCNDVLNFFKAIQRFSGDDVKVYTEYYHKIGDIEIWYFSNKNRDWSIVIDTDQSLFDRGKTNLGNRLIELYRLIDQCYGLLR